MFLMDTIKVGTPTSLNSTQSTIIQRFTILYALRKGYFNLIRHLLSNSACPNQIDVKDRTKRTPLIYCTFIKDDNWALSIAQNLLEYGANIGKSDIKGLNPLHYCCAFNKYKLLELFLNSLDFDLLNKVDLNGNTCLHYATKFRNLKCIRLILNKCKQYNYKIIETENLFGSKPTDLLNLNSAIPIQQQIVNKEVDDKCRLIIRNYDRDLLANRRSFDNIANKLPLAQLENLSSNHSQKDRPITAPTNAKLDTSDSHDGDDKDNNENKQKISFNVIPPSPPACSNNKNVSIISPPNSISNGTTNNNQTVVHKMHYLNVSNRPFSTQSYKFFKMHPNFSITNENGVVNNGTLQTNDDAVLYNQKNFQLKSKLRHSKSTLTIENRTKILKTLNNNNNDFNNNYNENQLLIDFNELVNNSIAYNNLCSDKEYIVNPNYMSNNTNTSINTLTTTNHSNNYQNQNFLNINTNQLKYKINENKFLSYNIHQYPVHVMANTIKNNNNNKFSNNIQLQHNNHDNQQLFVKTGQNAKLLSSPSLTLISGRQSRQSYFAGCMVTSQSDVLDQITLNDTEDVISGYNMNQELAGRQELQYMQQQIEQHYQDLVGWKKYMRNLLTELEYKESPSFRKTIHPPVNTQTATPSVDLNSSNDFSDKSKIISRKDTQKKAKHMPRQNSAMSTISTSALNSNSNNLNKKSKH